LAADAFQFGNHVVDAHSFNQSSNTLKVAVAATQECDVVDFSVFYVEVYTGTARA